MTDPILTPCPQHDWPALDLCPYCLQTELAVLRSAVKLGTSMIDDLTRERDVYRHRVKDLENTRAAQEAAMELVCAEGVRLRSLLASIYTEAGTTEDAGEFVLGLRERLNGEVGVCQSE